MENVKILGKHSNHQSHVCCQLIVELGFAKCQGIKTSFIFPTTKDLYHGNLCQFEVLWKRTNSYLDAENMCQRCVKTFMSISLAIVTHAFDIMVNLNINCSMLKEDVDRTSKTQKPIHHY
jgi:hypothetical protein